MAVEYARYLIPVPATFVPSCEQVMELIGALTAGGWLPERDSPCLQRVQYRIPDENAREIYTPATPWLFTLLPWVTRRPESRTWSQFPPQMDAPAVINASFVQERYDDGGLWLEYHVSRLDQADVRYPLARLDHKPKGAYFGLRFMMSEDFVYQTSETLDGYDDVNCSCGHPLVYEKPRDVFSPLCHFPLQCPECEREFDPAERSFRVYDGFTGEASEVAGGTVFRFAVVMDCGKCRPEADVEFCAEFRGVCRDVLGCEFIEIGEMY